MLARIKQKAKGFRTDLAAVALGGVGVLGMLGTLDLTPVVQLFVHNADALPLVMLLLAIGFGILRYITDSAPGGMNSAYQSAPTYRGVDQGE